MRTFSCQCDAVLFFQNTHCVQCQSATGLCCQCGEVQALLPSQDGRFRCHGCQAKLRLCQNREQYEVCNGTVVDEQTAALCDYCQLTTVIPNLDAEGHLVLWRRLESAKRRVVYQLDQLRLPWKTDNHSDGPRLQFEFKADGVQPVATGHADGVVTINVAEADSVAREKTRVEFGEPQRTLVGHFRHELGHYYWDLLVKPRRLQPFRRLFGDETNPSYEQAQQAYYAQPPDDSWREDFISRYASMHPWEDYAETFAAYLDMQAIVATARNFQRLKVNADGSDFDQTLAAYCDVGIAANEFNRDMGLLDLVPEIFTPPVVKKLRFIHDLRQHA